MVKNKTKRPREQKIRVKKTSKIVRSHVCVFLEVKLKPEGIGDYQNMSVLGCITLSIMG